MKWPQVAGEEEVSLELWRSCRSGFDRAALIFLCLICATAIFSTALVQTLIVGLTLLLVWRVVHIRGQLAPLAFQRTPLDAPYALFVLGRTLSVFLSQHPASSYPALYIEYFFYLVFFLITQSIRQNEAAVARVLLFILVWAGVLAGIIGALGYAFTDDARASSTSAGPYTLGAYLCAILPVSILAPSFASGQTSRGWSWTPVLPICLGILLTLDRLHWAGMVLAFVTTFLFWRLIPQPRWALLLAPGLAFAVALLSPSFQLRVAYMASPGVLFTGRDILWQGAARLISSHPVTGFGPRTFADIFPLFAQMPFGAGSWHNDYLQVYLESGLLGLLPLLWLIAAVYYYGGREIARSRYEAKSRTGSHEMLLSLLLSLTVIFLVGGMLDTLVGIVFRILLGLFALLIRPASAAQAG